MTNKHISDDEVERALRQLFNETAVDESVIGEIADSPNIWRQVRRNIDEARASRSPWPPVGNWLRWVAIAVSAAAVLVFSAGVIFYPIPESPAPVADVRQPSVESTVTTRVSEPPIAQKMDEVTVPGTRGTAIDKPSVVKSKATRTISRRESPASRREKASTSVPVKTDFIALSYARDPESGQIVRVKVPSSIMVSLGLVESVKKPNDLVDAEVLVGDDGLTRAIRFIR